MALSNETSNSKFQGIDKRWGNIVEGFLGTNAGCHVSSTSNLLLAPPH